VFSRVFTAHMSGNSTGLGAAVGHGQWQEALRRGVPIPVFVFGVVVGAIVIEALARLGVRRTMSVVLLAETALLLTAVAAGTLLEGRDDVVSTDHGWAFFGLVACLAAGMGVQTAALQRVGGHVVRTTYVTGMLTHLAEESVAVALRVHDEHGRGVTVRESVRHLGDEEAFRRGRLLAAVWGAYISGAVAGSLLDNWINLFALLPGVGVLLAVVALDQKAPIHVAADRRAAVDA